MVDMNQTQAAIRAGYKESSAAARASKLMKEPEVQAYRDELLEAEVRELGINRHSMIRETWKLYQKCMAAVPVMEWDSNLREYVESGVFKFDSSGAAKALALLMKTLEKIGPERVESAVPGVEDILGEDGL